MDKISEIVQGYLGMTPQDKGCKNWSEMQAQMVEELDEVVKNINYDTVLETVKCDCALSGGCVYEKMICDTKQECRHKM